MRSTSSLDVRNRARRQPEKASTTRARVDMATPINPPSTLSKTTKLSIKVTAKANEALLLAAYISPRLNSTQGTDPSQYDTGTGRR